MCIYIYIYICTHILVAILDLDLGPLETVHS